MFGKTPNPAAGPQCAEAGGNRRVLEKRRWIMAFAPTACSAITSFIFLAGRRIRVVIELRHRCSAVVQTSTRIPQTHCRHSHEQINQFNKPTTCVGVYQNSGVGGICRVRPVRVHLARRLEQKRIVTQQCTRSGVQHWRWLLEKRAKPQVEVLAKIECYTLFLLYIYVYIWIRIQPLLPALRCFQFIHTCTHSN